MKVSLNYKQQLDQLYQNTEYRSVSKGVNSTKDAILFVFLSKPFYTSNYLSSKTSIDPIDYRL